MPRNQFTLIANPRSGKGCAPALLDLIKPLFAAADAELCVYVTTHRGHARELARTLDLCSAAGLCLLGGDGLVHEVVDGLMRRAERAVVPLGIIPAGTGNAVSAHLKSVDPLEAVRRILAGHTVPMDILRVTTPQTVIHCVNQVGWGVVADITARADRMRILRRFRYTAATLVQMVFPERRPARLLLDDRILEGDFLFLLAANQKYVGHGMKIAPRAEIADGKMDVLVLREASRLQMLRLFAKVFDGSHLDLGLAEYFQVRSLSITTKNCDALELDGEVTGTSPIQVEVIPSAIRLFAARSD